MSKDLFEILLALIETFFLIHILNLLFYQGIT